MDLLIDSHVFIWWDTEHPKLNKTIRDRIANPDIRVFVSVATIWEIAIKQALGRLNFSGTPSSRLQPNGFLALDISVPDAELAASLPPLHQDPFDRMIVAQAINHKLALVTADRILRGYEVTTVMV